MSSKVWTLFAVVLFSWISNAMAHIFYYKIYLVQFGRTDDKRTNNPIPRCLWQTFKAWGIKMLNNRSRRSWEDKLKCVKILIVKDHNSAKICLTWIISPRSCTSRLVVQHPCRLSFKSMQGCRRSWEDQLKCVKILSVKGHNSAKIFRRWIISPHALLDLWCNIPAYFH